MKNIESYSPKGHSRWTAKGGLAHPFLPLSRRDPAIAVAKLCGGERYSISQLTEVRG